MNCIICNEYSDGSVTTFRNEQVPLCSKCIKQAAADLAGQSQQMSRVEIAQQFCDEVCAEAEANMLKTHKLEGSHFAAMQVVLKRWQEAAEK